MHDKEIAIVNHPYKASLTFEVRKDKDDFEKSSKSSKSLTEESMLVSTSLPVRILGKLKVRKSNVHQ